MDFPAPATPFPSPQHKTRQRLPPLATAHALPSLPCWYKSQTGSSNYSPSLTLLAEPYNSPKGDEPQSQPAYHDQESSLLVNNSLPPGCGVIAFACQHCVERKRSCRRSNNGKCDNCKSLRLECSPSALSFPSSAPPPTGWAGLESTGAATYARRRNAYMPQAYDSPNRFPPPNELPVGGLHRTSRQNIPFIGLPSMGGTSMSELQAIYYRQEQVISSLQADVGSSPLAPQSLFHTRAEPLQLQHPSPRKKMDLDYITAADV